VVALGEDCESKFCIHVFPSELRVRHNHSLYFNTLTLCHCGTSPNSFERPEKAFPGKVIVKVAATSYLPDTMS
jgi:hypothetical protein